MSAGTPVLHRQAPPRGNKATGSILNMYISSSCSKKSCSHFGEWPRVWWTYSSVIPTTQGEQRLFIYPHPIDVTFEQSSLELHCPLTRTLQLVLATRCVGERYSCLSYWECWEILCAFWCVLFRLNTTDLIYIVTWIRLIWICHKISWMNLSSVMKSHRHLNIIFFVFLGRRQNRTCIHDSP